MVPLTRVLGWCPTSTTQAWRKFGDDIAACAMGSLLAFVCLGMLPEAVEEAGGYSVTVGALVMTGFLLAFAFEHAVHVSREQAEAVVTPDCVETAHHAAHHGHHIPPVPTSLDQAGAGQLTLVDCDDESLGSHPRTACTAASRHDGDDADGNGPQAQLGGGASASGGPSAAEAEDLGVAVGPPAGPAPGGNDQGGLSAPSPSPAPAVPPAHLPLATLNKTVSGDSGADDGAALLHRVLPMMYIISVGDFVHSMVDGMVIGAAYMGCDESLGWAVMVSIILHELPQELGACERRCVVTRRGMRCVAPHALRRNTMWVGGCAAAGDYILLRHSGLSHWRALVVNFLTALGSLCGVVVVVGVGSRVLSLVGYFLAFGTVRRREPMRPVRRAWVCQFVPYVRGRRCHRGCCCSSRRPTFSLPSCARPAPSAPSSAPSSSCCRWRPLR